MKRNRMLMILLIGSLALPLACGKALTPLEPAAPTATPTFTFTGSPTGTATPTSTPTVVFNYVGSFGTSGTGNGNFSNPTGIAVDSLNNVYVFDSNNGRVEKFTSGGDYASQIDGLTAGYGIAVQPVSENLYVLDKTYYLNEYNSSGQFVTQWTISGSIDDYLFGVAVDTNGNAYVADSAFGAEAINSGGSQTINYGLNYSQDGPGGSFSCLGVVPDPSGTHVYMANSSQNNIVEFTTSGAYVTQWGSGGSGNGQFNQPSGMGVDQRGRVYVVDGYNNRVEVFDANGNYLTQFGSGGSGNGQFSTPFGVAVNSWGKVYVTDTGDNRVEVFSPG